MLSWMQQYGYVGMGLLIALENIFPPIPSELILTFGGFLTGCTGLGLPGMILHATLGSLAGAFFLYAAGRCMTPEKLTKLLEQSFCKKLGFQKEQVDKALYKFEKQGKRAVLLGRCVPIVRSLVSIPAGMAKMNLCSFFWLTAVGSTLWNTALLSLGAGAGKSWQLAAERCEAYIKGAKLLLLAIVCVWAGYTVLKKHKEKRRRGE